MIRNRYNYPTPPIRDIIGKKTQTRNYWTLMETSLAESQTDSYFPTKWPNGYPKQKRCKRHTHSKTNYNKKKNHDRRTALERSVKSISLGGLNHRDETTMRTQQHETTEMPEQKKTNSKTPVGPTRKNPVISYYLL